jgi:RimJ/RimL family protein N-acetyltransferase
VTGDVLLRDLREDDLPILLEHQLDPVANSMAGFTPRDRDAFMAHWTKLLADQTIVKKTVLLDGHVAGNVLSFEHSGRREVGYWIGREHWGKGLATKALTAFLSYERTRPIYAGVARHNVPSIRVLQKCGFTIADEGSEASSAGSEQEEQEILLKLEA